eukprot:11397212-Heterocapsa_arctica.AAC.1
MTGGPPAGRPPPAGPKAAGGWAAGPSRTNSWRVALASSAAGSVCTEPAASSRPLSAFSLFWKSRICADCAEQ